jgi:DNA replication protein DnaC
MTKQTETRQCLKCSNEYEPEYYDLMGSKLLKGQGLCLPCRKIALAELEAKEKVAESARIMGDRKKARVHTGIPLKYLTQDFSTFEKGWQDKAFKLCWEYADGFPVHTRPVGHHSLFLHGEVGTGKSHLVCAIAHTIFDNWKGGERGCPRVVFVSEPDLFRKIQATYSFDAEEKRVRESEDDIIKGISYCDLLILDDLGKERRDNPAFVQRTLFAIIDNRYRLQLPLIITANFGVEGVTKHLGDASFDRFFEMVKGKHTSLIGKSYRRK